MHLTLGPLCGVWWATCCVCTSMLGVIQQLCSRLAWPCSFAAVGHAIMVLNSTGKAALDSVLTSYGRWETNFGLCACGIASLRVARSTPGAGGNTVGSGGHPRFMSICGPAAYGLMSG